MDIKLVEKIELADGVHRFLLEMSFASFLFVGNILESFEGICVYTTPERHKNIMQVDVVLDMLSDFKGILKELRKE